MKSVFPVAYFGSIYYFKKLLQESDSVFELNEYFVKQSLRSRCEILSANGRIQLNLPVSKTFGSKTKMLDVHINYTTDWQRVHWKAIESAYASAPYFEDYAAEVYAIIYSNCQTLVGLNMQTIELIANRLELSLTYETSTEYVSRESGNDFRQCSFNQSPSTPSYIQVFSDKFEFEPNLSILDLLFCEGPMARKLLIN